MEKTPPFRLKVGLLVFGLALGIHFLLFFWMKDLSETIPDGGKRRSAISVSMAPRLNTRLEKKLVTPVAKDPLQGQVVRVTKPVEEKKPEKAKYLAETDSSVKKETQSKKMPGGVTPPIGKDLSQKKPISKRPQIAKQTIPKNPVTEPPKKEGTGSAASQNNPSSSSLGTQNEKEPKSVAGATSNQEGNPSKKPNLFLSPYQMAKISGMNPGQGGSSDSLKGVEDGDVTKLNANSWKYASFFNRVKEAVRVQWHPDRVLMRKDPYGHVYGVKSRVTVLGVCLTSEGAVCGLHVVQASEVAELDQEAIKAFQEAQPFQNPPRTLVGNDGKIHFHFGFIVEMTGRSHFQITRGNF